MINPRSVLCIYHGGGCTDGFTAAWVVRKALGPDTEFYAAKYGDAPPDVFMRDVVIVDFSYKYEVLSEMAKSAHSILILDHHKTAEEELAVLNTAPDFEVWKEAAWDGKLSQGVRVAAIFDMNRSGAGIAWDYFFPEDDRPELLNFIEDRDLWRFKFDATRLACAAVFSYNLTFDNWDSMFTGLVENLIDDGKALERQHQKNVQAAIPSAREMLIGGHAVLVANVPPGMASDVGHALALGRPFGATYIDKPTHREFSLRSTDEGIDCSEIAKMYGGGGHRNASGFRVGYHHRLAGLISLKGDV